MVVTGESLIFVNATIQDYCILGTSVVLFMVWVFASAVLQIGGWN